MGCRYAPSLHIWAANDDGQHLRAATWALGDEEFVRDSRLLKN